MEQEAAAELAEIERTNPYKRNCPACGGVIIGRCRCGGPHDLEMLRKGHGDKCKNGHHSDVKTNLTIDSNTGEVLQSMKTARLFTFEDVKPYSKKGLKELIDKLMDKHEPILAQRVMDILAFNWQGIVFKVMKPFTSGFWYTKSGKEDVTRRFEVPTGTFLEFVGYRVLPNRDRIAIMRPLREQDASGLKTLQESTGEEVELKPYKPNQNTPIHLDWDKLLANGTLKGVKPGDVSFKPTPVSEQLPAVAAVQNEPTPEMASHFQDRTNKHIGLVQKYCKLIGLEGLEERGQVHDASKFEEPEKLPYVWLTWRYKCKDDETECVLPEGMDKKIDEATEHHILSNAHHPEFHQEKRSGLLNSKDRDQPPEEMIDSTKMTPLDIAEMVADWCAMSEERGNTPREWADKNVNVRWGFTPEQTAHIYELIDGAWKDTLEDDHGEFYAGKEETWPSNLCPTCQGFGKVYKEDDYTPDFEDEGIECPDCHGTGISRRGAYCRQSKVLKTAILKECREKDIDPDRPRSEQKWCLYSKSTGKLLGRHPSKEDAMKQEQAIHVNKGGCVTLARRLASKGYSEEALELLKTEFNEWSEGQLLMLLLEEGPMNPNTEGGRIQKRFEELGGWKKQAAITNDVAKVQQAVGQRILSISDFSTDPFGVVDLYLEDGSTLAVHVHPREMQAAMGRKEKEAIRKLVELGAELSRQEEALGDTKTGWWYEGVYLAPSNDPVAALTVIAG
jgi:hypothetical protein